MDLKDFKNSVLLMPAIILKPPPLSKLMKIKAIIFQKGKEFLQYFTSLQVLSTSGTVLLLSLAFL
jgi:hypothetical protein